MSDHWGVDSWTPANDSLGGGRFFFDSVSDRAGRRLEFLGSLSEQL